MKKLAVFAGGGVRALYALQTAKYVEAKTKKQYHELFDLLIGTSTGGLVALAMTKRVPWTAEETEQFYLHNCPVIFAQNFASKLDTVWGLKKPKYDPKGLQQAARAAFGSEMLTSNVATVTFNVTTFEPVLMHGPSSLSRYDAALATSAAPSYFPLHRIDSSEYCDGGLVSNYPVLLGLAELGTTDALVLGHGCGVPHEGWPVGQITSMGELAAIQPVLSIAMDGEVLTDDMVMRLALAKGYLYMQGDLKNAAMDDVSASNMQTLIAAGQALVKSKQYELDAFCERLVG